MSNPVDILGVHPRGAYERRPDPRDYPWQAQEIAQATAPFDWDIGYDVEHEIGFPLTTKNQGNAGSCGGQGFSYYGQALSAALGMGAVERSAKYLYSQVYAPGGGSSDRELAKIAINQGFAPESLCPSYEGGNPPSEAFMERPQDITAQARVAAAKDKIMMAYSFPEITIDSVAQALSACKGIVLGLHGSNNGTWLSAEPSPQSASVEWSHYMYAGKAFKENGIKKVWAKQSWGPKVGLNGWQKLNESFFNSGRIWGAIVLILNPKPGTPPQYNFAADIKEGDTGAPVLALQTFLAYDGCFNLKPTGLYGPITATAVFKFQVKYGVASPIILDELAGKVVGPATRAKLNNLTK